METMTDADWISVSRYFKCKEFDCPGVPGSGNNMSLEFIKFLYNMRGVLGFPLPVSVGGGFRTKEYHEELYKRIGKKAGDSDHLRGEGIDIPYKVGERTYLDSHKLYLVLQYCFDNKVKRLEICDRHLHIGYSTVLPQEVCVIGKSQ